jgi:hypothetical protein
VGDEAVVHQCPAGRHDAGLHSPDDLDVGDLERQVVQAAARTSNGRSACSQSVSSRTPSAPRKT